MSRTEKLRKLLDFGSLDAILVTGAVNRRYISGFTGSNGAVLLSRDGVWFATDFRYSQQAAAQCQGFTVVTLKSDEKLSDWVAGFGFQRIGFEANVWTVDAFEALRQIERTEWIPVQAELMKLRAVKDPEEIASVERAAAIADRAYQHILSYIKPGLTENEVALELEFFMRQAGATGLSFESIVASGERSSMPHGVASEKVIADGDLLTLDFGCVVDGYCSDMTRTLMVGKAHPDQRKLYELVLAAQLASLEAVKAGATCSEVDLAGRSIIDGAGYAEAFGHGTGHGVGLDIHEYPRVAAASDTVLEAGMVITIEPGVYLPGFGGVRIEDLVVVTENGYKLLSASPKQLIELS